jgi:RHS repeat-associated protein
MTQEVYATILSPVCVNHFTGKERDTESGLDYFGARYYGSSMGRFMSPDPGWMLQADVSNPQTLNMYSYVLNNPLRFIDPTGLECVWSDGSYDSNDDNDTGDNAGTNGDHSGCRGQGGAWVDHSFFANQGAADWSNSGNADLAGIYTAITSNSSTVNVNADGSGSAMTTNFGYSPSFGLNFTKQDTWQGPNRIYALARGVTSTNCATDAFKRNALAMGLDAVGLVPGTGEAKLVADVGNATVQAANSAVQGDATGAGLSMGDMVTKPIIDAVKHNGASAIPVLGEAYSGFLLGRDIWNASGEVARCW